MNNKFEYKCMCCEKPIPMTGFCKTCNDKALEIELSAEKMNALADKCRLTPKT